MRSICIYFQVHQPYRLRTYRFFNIGNDHHYYDEYQNRHIVRRVAEKCYLPANKMMLELIRQHEGKFRISYSISGNALDQFRQYVPEVLDTFRQLADTGCVEFLAETHAHSLASLRNKEEFVRQVRKHQQDIFDLFGQQPVNFRNSELIYSDTIGETVAEMGFHTMLTEGPKHILGWKSPNYMYCNNLNPKLKVLLRNFRLSDDLSFRFSNQDWSEWPLTTAKFAKWLNDLPPHEEVVNLFLDYETIGEHQWKESGIFDFFRHLPTAVFEKTDFSFKTPEELYRTLQPISAVSVPYAISWADEERDLTAWLGNELQDDAFARLYSLAPRMQEVTDPDLLRDWQYLQTSNHFYYMCTKWFSAGEVHKHFNPYSSPYEAYINYMNILSDFIIRLDQYSADATVPVITPEIKPATVKAASGKKATARKSAAEKPKTGKTEPVKKKKSESEKKDKTKGTSSKKSASKGSTKSKK